MSECLSEIPVFYEVHFCLVILCSEGQDFPLPSVRTPGALGLNVGLLFLERAVPVSGACAVVFLSSAFLG